MDRGDTIECCMQVLEKAMIDNRHTRQTGWSVDHDAINCLVRVSCQAIPSYDQGVELTWFSTAAGYSGIKVINENNLADDPNALVENLNLGEDPNEVLDKPVEPERIMTGPQIDNEKLLQDMNSGTEVYGELSNDSKENEAL